MADRIDTAMWRAHLATGGVLTDEQERELLDELHAARARIAELEAVPPLRLSVIRDAAEAERLRAEVAGWREDAAALVAALPKCGGCDKPATRAYRRGAGRYCDEHGTHPDESVPEYPRAAPLRRLSARLAGEHHPPRHEALERPPTITEAEVREALRRGAKEANEAMAVRAADGLPDLTLRLGASALADAARVAHPGQIKIDGEPRPVTRETPDEARARVQALLATGEPDRELAAAEPALEAARREYEEADRTPPTKEHMMKSYIDAQPGAAPDADGGSIVLCDLGSAVAAQPGKLYFTSGPPLGAASFGDIVFRVGREDVLTLGGDGTIRVRGEPVEFPEEAAEGLREWFSRVQRVEPADAPPPWWREAVALADSACDFVRHDPDMKQEIREYEAVIERAKGEAAKAAGGTDV